MFPPYKKRSRRTLERRERNAELKPRFRPYRREQRADEPTPIWIDENKKLINQLLEHYEKENGKLHAELKDLLRKRKAEQKRVEYMNLTPEKRAGREKRQLAYRQQLASKTI